MSTLNEVLAWQTAFTTAFVSVVSSVDDLDADQTLVGFDADGKPVTVTNSVVTDIRAEKVVDSRYVRYPLSLLSHSPQAVVYGVRGLDGDITPCASKVDAMYRSIDADLEPVSFVDGTWQVIEGE